MLREELKRAGFELPIGGATGSTAKWIEYFKNNPTAQAKALDTVLKASRAIDQKHGTTLTQGVWHNLVGGNIRFVP